MPPPQEIIPMFAFLSIFGIPLVIILTRHQQKMTELIRRDSLPQGQASNDLLAVQYDIQQLKSMVTTLTMSVDSLKEEVRDSNSIQDRVKVGE
jgi:uncharacterized protein YlxW (UPF0749 family)